MSANYSATNPKQFIWAFLSTLPKYLLVAITIITVLAIFVPLSPDMPAAGLDSS
jgi:hypothetical protein